MAAKSPPVVRATFLACLLLMSVGPAAAQRAAEPRPNAQIITDEAIKRAGLVRLGEITRLLDGWVAASIDGFNRQLAPVGAVPGTQPWTLWVDGHRVYMEGWSLRQLDRLPIPLEDVAYVEVSTVPQVFQGSLVSRGIIHIHTHRPPAGWTLRAGYWTGNESGDPGPYRFTPEGSRVNNVDRLGPDYEASLAYRRGVWGRVGGLTRIHFPTDPAILPRLRPLMNDYPQRRTAGLNLQVRNETSRSTTGFWAGLAGAEDFVYLRPLAQQIPALTLYGQAGLQGHWSFTPVWSMRYRAGYATNRMTGREDAAGLAPDWRVDHRAAHISLRREQLASRAEAGAFVEQEVAHMGTTLDNDSRTVTGGFVQYQRTQTWGPQPGAALQVRYDGSDWAYQALANASWYVRPVHTFTGAVSYTERYFAEVYDYWHWTRQGAPLLDDLGVSYDIEGAPAKTRLLKADFRWRIVPTQLFEARIGTFYKYYLDATLEQRDLSYQVDTDAYAGSARVVSGLGGHVAGGFLSVSYRWQPWLLQRMLYQLHKDIAADEQFLALREAQPDFLARTAFVYQPRQSLSVELLATYQSATNWAGYGEGRGLYVPPFFRIDLAATKWFWDRRLRGQVVVRNVLNESYRTFPAGPTFPLSLLIRLGLHF